MKQAIVLASASPRRRELFKIITDNFEVIPSQADETIDLSLPPAEIVMRLAEKKALSVALEHPDQIVVGCDTIVVLNGDILGKPADPEEAKGMLRRLSGRVHTVYTGTCLCTAFGAEEPKTTARCFFEATEVEFFPLTEAEIDAYVDSGEPLDKAGAYGIQEKGALLVKSVNGDYFSVVGLSLARLNRELRVFASDLENRELGA